MLRKFLLSGILSLVTKIGLGAPLVQAWTFNVDGLRCDLGTVNERLSCLKPNVNDGVVSVIALQETEMGRRKFLGVINNLTVLAKPFPDLHTLRTFIVYNKNSGLKVRVHKGKVIGISLVTQGIRPGLMNLVSIENEQSKIMSQFIVINVHLKSSFNADLIEKLQDLFHGLCFGLEAERIFEESLQSIRMTGDLNTDVAQVLEAMKSAGNGQLAHIQDKIASALREAKETMPSRKIRSQQLQNILVTLEEKIEAVNEFSQEMPIIILGDFNATEGALVNRGETEESIAIETMMATYGFTRAKRSVDDHSLPAMKVTPDMIFVRSAQIDDVNVLPQTTSDHRAVVAKLQMFEVE